MPICLCVENEMLVIFRLKKVSENEHQVSVFGHKIFLVQKKCDYYNKDVPKNVIYYIKSFQNCDYSLLIAFTGFAIAALIACQQTVSKAIPIVNTATANNNHHGIVVR